jgi:hypothetical protein
MSSSESSVLSSFGLANPTLPLKREKPVTLNLHGSGGIVAVSSYLADLVSFCKKTHLFVRVYHLVPTSIFTCKYTLQLQGSERDLAVLSGWIEGYSSAQEHFSKRKDNCAKCGTKTK